MKVVILAGGLGTRISEESHLRPKPMLGIGAQPILWHIMKHFSYYSFNDFIICCGYMGYVIKEYFSNYYLHTSDVTFDFTDNNSMTVHNNMAEPWKVTLVDTGLNTQTGGRVRRIQDYLRDEKFLLTYGDGISNIDIRRLVAHHEKSGKVATVSAVQPKGRFGVLDVDDSTDSVLGFREKASEDAGWINAGYMVVEPGLFSFLNGDSCILEHDALPLMASEGLLGVYKHRGFWLCIDTLRDRVTAEHMWNSGNAPWKVW